MPIATAVHRSGNRKLGGVAATLVSQISCPTSCPFFHNGCYAERGRHGLHTMRLNDNTEGLDGLDAAYAEAEAIDGLKISKLHENRALRLHTVGDCATEDAARIVSQAVSRFKERGGGPVWTYTHASKDVPREAWGEDVSVLASSENLEEAKEAMSRGYAAAIVVEHHPENGKAYEEQGVKVIPCPNQTHEGVTCADCRLCWNDKRLLAKGAVIAFEAHGSGKENVIQVIKEKG